MTRDQLEDLLELARRVAAGDGAFPDVIDMACRLTGVPEYAQREADPAAPRPWVRMRRIWEMAVHNGSPMGGNMHLQQRWLTGLMPALIAREPQDPLGLYERVVRAYVADKKKQGKGLVLQWFCGSDFELWVQRVHREPDRSAPAGPDPYMLQKQAEERALEGQMLTPGEARALMGAVKSAVRQRLH